MKLENLTFRGGTHIEEFKELSSGSLPSPMPAPGKVILTMSQHIGAPAKPLVKKGDEVKMGQKIAEAGGFVSAPVHSSVSGTVLGIVNYRSATGQLVQAIEIENDGQDSLGYEEVDRSKDDLSIEEMLDYIKEAGIVGMGGAGFPTHVKLQPPKDTPVDTIIINGAECEPYLTCDDVTMRTKPEKIVAGLALMMKIAGAKKGFIAIEDNKPDAIAAVEKALEGKGENMALAVLKTKYPQGDEKRIITAVTGREVPMGGLPAAVGCIVDNVGTTCAIVDAVYYGKPLYERVVTVTGHALNEPKNLLVRFGTTIGEVLDYAGGLATEAGKIIFGGPMMGVAQASVDSVTDKRNNGILVLTKEEAEPQRIDPCIRCNRCVEVCPVFLEPLIIASASKMENWDIAQANDVTACIECGSCSYICPSHRPLTELIRFGKQEVMAMNRKKK
ncbi:electron transport complex subunit RsxC [Kallipyga massiliensis]|uniref:electron transport complex subunit RsxC n=1 Tax=Kallipyga massiliensis TaxID=1472764 RepID=UPI0026EB6C63|nr:electron transport complex subunit RsxC [Kallipyga massiliensis]